MGNRAKQGTPAVTPARYTRFTPKWSVIREKKNTVTTPFRIPKKDMTIPIAGGSSPRPPSAMGVERNTGCRARKDMSISARDE
jgi:hypothetical protein